MELTLVSGRHNALPKNVPLYKDSRELVPWTHENRKKNNSQDLAVSQPMITAPPVPRILEHHSACRENKETGVISSTN